MTGIELYINQQLCDIENPKEFSVYLKRQLLNPSELSTKDAQRSYDITLPASATNNAIFGYINTEEVRGKFARLYDAHLLVGGVKIFDGKFKLSEIAKTYYKGNLGIPAQKTVKDIFAEKMMNEAGNWEIDFEDQTWITKYNTGEYDKNKYGDISPCIFPLVLYGLLPKKPLDAEKGIYTDKELLDEYVDFKRDNFPPSVNCLKMLETIFKNEGLNLGGSAFNDERLTNLYMSYKNPTEYEMPWNYGTLGQMGIRGDWSNYVKRPSPLLGTFVERKFKRNEPEDGHALYAVDMLNSTNTTPQIYANTGNNITTENGKTTITIPYTGLYKIHFTSSFTLHHQAINGVLNENPRIIDIGSNYQKNNETIYHYENLEERRFEIKVMRDRFDDDAFNLEKVQYDNVFYRNNLEQDKWEASKIQYFPQPGPQSVNFIDPAQNANLLCGFSFGSNYENYNPTEENGRYCNIMATSGGQSWSDTKVRSYSAVASPPYMEAKYVNNKWEYTTHKDMFYVNMINSRNEVVTMEWMMKPKTWSWGEVMQVVKLEKGEKITVISNSDEGVHYRWDGRSKPEAYNHGWLHHSIDYNLYIEAFQYNDDWLKIDNEGKSIEGTVMDYSESNDTIVNKLNLIRFLPSNVKINDWIDNFCKAFNLDLIQTTGDTFELNTKQKRILNTSSIINLDNKTDVNSNRRNTSLGLPASYELGFSINTNEEGFIKSKSGDTENGDTGGGLYETGSPENKRVNQASNFSYNWFKTIKDNSTEENYNLPIISEKEPWERTNSGDYADMLNKKYSNLAQRFWYKKDNEIYPTSIDGGVKIEAGLVSNEYNGSNPIKLHYKNEEHSILDNYFALMADADNQYTTVECYLTPKEYSRVDNSWVQFNNDLYYVAEIDGYDPMNRKKASLKLIRKSV
ncbi:hypothetical protein [Dysgonomonas sp. ZJ279]|uniref:hypothetical protein n=1 Tax=Dysgonomonas sp. ZJ279 TaxID=2709796 RepID=UPI0013EA278F|nr:hypothetical protein [Dysgonomonas sp. ZJ279]